jgi:hypothetical protein
MGSSIKEAYITRLYPLEVITFSEDLLFIGRFNPTGALETSCQSETYRKVSMVKPGPEYDGWIEGHVAYWRFVETGDVGLVLKWKKGFKNGTLGKGRIYMVEGE